jgi:hypothetical protein
LECKFDYAVSPGHKVCTTIFSTNPNTLEKGEKSMKNVKNMLAIGCFLLLVLSLTSAPADNGADETPARFEATNLTINDKEIGSKEDAEKYLGSPDEIKFYDEITGDEVREEWIYDGLTLTFRYSKLIKAEIYKKGYTGPHMVEVGMLARDVVNSFYASPNSPNSGQFYWNEALGAFDPNHPEADCGYAEKGDDGFAYFKYLASLNPRSDDLDRIDQDEYDMAENDSEYNFTSFEVKLDDTGVVSMVWSTY